MYHDNGSIKVISVMLGYGSRVAICLATKTPNTAAVITRKNIS